MSLEDESQQPFIPGAAQPATSVEIILQMAQQHPEADFGPPSDDDSTGHSLIVHQPPFAGDISMESDTSEAIRWGSPHHLAFASQHTSRESAIPIPPAPLLPAVPEQADERSEDGRISSPSEGEKATSGVIPSASAESAEISEHAPDAEVPDDSYISSPAISDPEVTTSKKRETRHSQSDARPSTPSRSLMQPLVTIPAVAVQHPSVTRNMTTPLKHASHVSPSKTRPPSANTTPTKSAIRPVSQPTPSSRKHAAVRAPSPESSGYFTSGMVPKEKPQKVMERLLSHKELELASQSSSEPSFQPVQPRAQSRGRSVPSEHPATDGPPPMECPPPSSGVVEDLLSDDPEPTYLNPPEETPKTNLWLEEDEVAGGNSETPAESGSGPLFPLGSPSNRFGNLASSLTESQTRPSSLGALFSDSYEEIGGASESQVQREDDSFVATQVIAPLGSSPARVPAPGPSVASTRSTTSSKPLPSYRMLKRRHDSTSDASAPAARPRAQTPPSQLEATFVDNTYIDPPSQSTGAKPDIEMTAEEHGSESAVVLPPSGEQQSIPLDATAEAGEPEEPAPNGQVKETTPTPMARASPGPSSINTPPPQSINPVTDVYNVKDGTIFHPPRPRPSPHKYGGRKRSAATPSYDGGSDSSSAPEDPQDDTFQETATHAASPSPVKTAKIKTPQLSPRGPSSIISSRIPGRGKRKQMSPSAILSSSSSSAPEDEEDFSYRPTIKAQAKAKAAAKPKSPPKKKMKSEKKTNNTSKGSRALTAASRPSTSRSTSARAGSRAASARAVSVSAADVSPPHASAIRVLALSSSTKGSRIKAYFAGTVVGQNSRSYRIKFDDNCSSALGADKVRLLHLRPGDVVYDGKEPTRYRVTKEFINTGDFVHVRDENNKPHKIKVIRLVILPGDITAFDDRTVPQAFVDAQFPIASSRSSLSTFNSLNGKTFLITGKDARMTPENLKRRIESHGGEVIEQWESVFSITSDAEYTIVSNGTPFVLQLGDKCIMTPKVMAALGSGIPLLSAHYIEAAISDGVDWRSYLISPGHSHSLAQPASQLVDPKWGEQGWDKSTARSVRRPFKRKTVLFVEASSKFPRKDEINTLVPFCLMALGATVMRATVLPSVIETDMVVVEQRDKRLKISQAALESGKLGNVAWLKTCLAVGGAFAPGLLEE